MNILGHLTVRPELPAPVARLGELATNLYWTWEPAARALFRDLDPHLWEAHGHNPVRLLREVRQQRLDAAAEDPAYLASYAEVIAAFDAYLNGANWFRSAGPGADGGGDHTYAYFCAEYGWHESMQLYSGGLGVLAGDHTKAASDLGVPLVCVGLWYPEGYFHQRVDPDGLQKAVFESKRADELPLTLVADRNGEPVTATVTVFGRDVTLQAWKVAVGSVSVYLLDVDHPDNHEEDRTLLRRLYGGDQRTRIAQEIVLGVGGVRMLRALAIEPTAWHMNEGHSAFMALERCRELVAEGLSFDQAREAVQASTAFTVHTPVAAGNDAFAFDLINQCFSGFWGSLGLRQHEFHDLGRADHGWGPVFSMPALALRFSSSRNGVAELHGRTSRRIWNDLWAEVPEEEVPIAHITNGVHLPTWVAPEVQALVEAHAPADWRERIDEPEVWRGVRDIDPGELWEVRRQLKAQSVRFLRRRVLRQLDRYEASPSALKDTGELFDSEALTIGFARRFATYKRATLIFRDLDRLARLLSDPERPVQLVFSGKAHPADQPGQALIAHIHNLSYDPRFAGKILFVEDYDMAIGRALTRGVDVWLNNPRRPLEASGTSGQKAAMNGILNLSILDGWWPEGFNGENGWAIGTGRGFENDERADAADADALYTLLEREVIPLYYERDARGVPTGWLERAKEAIATVSPAFNARRMVRDYVRIAYAPASERGAALRADDFAAARELASWRRQVHEAFPQVYVQAQPVEDVVRRSGDRVTLEAVVHPQALERNRLCVEVVYTSEHDALAEGLHRVPMEPVEELDDGAVRYRATFRPAITGRLAYGIRAYPLHPLLASPFDAHAIRWA